MKMLIRAATCLVLLVSPWVLRTSVAAQIKVLPGSVIRGEGVLETSNCLGCHSLNGRGGAQAPDFAKLADRGRSPSLLAVSMWNHMPRMWSAFEAEARSIPMLSSEEAADLFAFFYASLYLAPRGDESEGKNLFAQKGCASCHTEAATQKWAQILDPVSMAERLWNHTGNMDAAMANRGVSWPRLTEGEAADLLTFLARRAGGPDAVFSLGDPEFGRNVFEGSCESCHEFGDADSSKVNLLGESSPASMMSYVAAMWNHAPDMRRRGGSVAQLEPGEMRDLMAYLFSRYYFFDPGDAAKGSRVYEAKNCKTCHEPRITELRAPDLTQATELYSPITLTAAAWRHGPSMLRAANQRGISWPEFQSSEMKDLIAYLNSRLVKRIG